MSKTVRISAAFSTISSRLDSFGWPYECFPPKQLAINGFYKSPSDKPNEVICFSCGAKGYCVGSSNVITDRQLLARHDENCLWADMRREIMAHSSSVITRPTDHSVVAGPPQQQLETECSPSPDRSSPSSSPLSTANTTSVETATESSPTSADSLRTRSDSTPPCQRPQSTSQEPISDQDTSVATAPYFFSEFSLSGLPTHSSFQLSVEGREISSKLRCDYCINNVAKLDKPQMKKRKIIYADQAGRTGSKEK
ncbi:uncharacterized protein K444DRAFT_608262 [Hyaloscypha bicolor E]|uniref:Uncharacterized protein n=1 Tax=Hyaloscypha bicolor E TaxID=1095630 RepID=A0A2J6TRP2_9HELO|nr:uncharacterized protein K444DRAFT_608262 [Hyaloscypha bicolor E]PMD65690.1 hypothetical protein K444DRAFT_608262 [Hyaloscypha bicolor E]